MLPPAAGGKSSRLGRRQEKEAMESCFSFGLEEEAFGILADHKIGGRPVVPLALSMEWLGHGALHGNPGLKLLGYDDVRVLKALHLGDGPRQVQVVSAPVQRVGECFQQKLVLQSKDASGEVLRHVGGVALLGAKAPEIPELVKKPGGVVPRGIYLRSLEDAYTKVLFHGEGLWGLQEVRDFGEGGMEAVVSTAPPPAQWMAAPMRRRWVHDPLVLDCAFQMAILWCYETQGMVSLPSSVGRYRQLQRFPKGEVSLKLDVTKVSPHKMCGDFSVRDADGRLVARLMDYTCTMDASLWRAFHG